MSSSTPVGILRNAANDVRGELLEQQRLVGVSGRMGGGEVDRDAVGRRASAAASAGLLWARGVVADAAVGSIRADLAPVAQARARARTAGSHAASGIVDVELICRLVGLVRA